MRNYLNVSLIAIFLYLISTGCAKKDSKTSITLKTKLDTISYLIGSNIGTNFKQNGIEVNNEILLKGIEEGVKGDKPFLSEEVIKKVMMSFQKEMTAKQEVKMKEETDKVKKEGESFLMENKKKEGIITLPSGLQYKVVKMGKGPKPKETDVVKCNYEGTLINGKVFDSSYQKNQPATFPLNQVIKGWTEGLQLMPVGSEYMLYLPSELAYGDRSQNSIPGGSTLIFKIELLSIEKAPKEEKKK